VLLICGGGGGGGGDICAEVAQQIDQHVWDNERSTLLVILDRK
jgi:hypothetical protein